MITPWLNSVPVAKYRSKLTKKDVHGHFSTIYIHFEQVFAQKDKQVCMKHAQINNKNITQPAFTCSKLTIKTLEQVVKYVQS